MSRAKNVAAGIIGRRKGKPVDEREHPFYICEECGQAIDKRELGEGAPPRGSRGTRDCPTTRKNRCGLA